MNLRSHLHFPSERVVTFSVATLWAIISLIWGLLNLALTTVTTPGKAVYAGITGVLAVGAAWLILEYAATVYHETHVEDGDPA